MCSTPRLAIALSIAGVLCVSCVSHRTCALLVIVDGGRYVASPQQLANLERRIAPLLAERGLTLSYDKEYAHMIARVEFTSDTTNPLEGDIVIRSIDPNPTPGASEGNQPDRLQRMQEELYRNGPRPSVDGLSESRKR